MAGKNKIHVSPGPAEFAVSHQQGDAEEIWETYQTSLRM